MCAFIFAMRIVLIKFGLGNVQSCSESHDKEQA